MPPEHPLVRLARRAVEGYVGQSPKATRPRRLSPEMRGRAGVFVSIKRGGDLRGCIGTVAPSQPNVALEVVHNAINAATNDPRFNPVAPEELPELSYSVDVLGPLEAVAAGPEALDPKRYGIVVVNGPRRGLLLPDIEGVETVEEQIAIAKAKAWIQPWEAVELYRFQVQRYC